MLRKFSYVLVAGAAAAWLSAIAADEQKQQQGAKIDDSKTAPASAPSPTVQARAGGPSSSSERTAEPAPEGYGPPAGEPTADQAK